MKNAHPQTWITVNQPVDSGVARLVSALSTVPELQTVQSCQGDHGKAAYVWFRYGDYKRVSELVFERLAPALREVPCTLAVETFNGSDPIGRIEFETEATQWVTSAVKSAVTP